MRRGTKVGGTPTPPRAPFEKKANEIRKELARVNKVSEQQTAKTKKDCRVLVDAAQEAQFNAETKLADALLARADVAKLNIANQRGWFGRVWFRLMYLFTGRIA